jgi:hypothetical protein
VNEFDHNHVGRLLDLAVVAIRRSIKESEERIMATTQAQLDAAIAALPAQIETAVETALAPVITAIQNAAASNGVDLTSEVASLQAIPATVSTAIATALTPATPTPAPTTQA